MLRTTPTLVVALLVTCFTTTMTTTSAFTMPVTRLAPLRPPMVPTASSSTSTRMAAAISNPLGKLPWNVKREQEKAARRLKQERNALHRQLGIAEDATYEDIVAATDSLIAKAGDDLKAKVKIEIAKDKILQIRLNERLAGLNTATKDARAQSRFEQEG